MELWNWILFKKQNKVIESDVSAPGAGIRRIIKQQILIHMRIPVP